MRRIFPTLLLIAAMATAHSARAEAIFVSYMDLQHGSQQVQLSGGVFGSGQTFIAGQQHLTVNAGTVNSPANYFDVYAWCVDVFHTINLGANAIVYTLGDLVQNGNNGLLNTQQIGQISWLAAYGNQALQAGADPLLSAAVQTLIWNVEYGSTYSGNDAAMSAKLAQLTALLPANPIVPQTVALTATNGAGAIVAQTLVTGPVPVPEPASLLLLASGLLGLGLVRARRG